MKTRNVTAGVTVLLFSPILGCDDEASGDGEEASDGPELVSKELEDLGLQADLPEDAEIEEGIGGDGVQINTRQFPPLHISHPGDFDPTELEDGIEDAEMHDRFEEIVHEEELEDGWVMGYLTEDVTGDPEYQIVGYRELAGEEYDCTGFFNSEEELETVIEACKSLEAQ